MRRIRLVLLCSLVATCCAAPAATASVAHTVGPGETLWSIAAASNLTTRTLAAANGLSPDANVVLGGTIQIPSVAEGSAALQRAGIVPGSGAAGTTSTAGAPRPMGGYVVRPGDTLSAIAARARVQLGQIAFMNGLDPRRYLLVGT